jgi:hypothetical protein
MGRHDLRGRSLRGVQAVWLGGQPLHHRVPLLRSPAAQACTEAPPSARPYEVSACAKGLTPAARTDAAGPSAGASRRRLRRGRLSLGGHVLCHDRAGVGQLCGVGGVARRTAHLRENGDHRSPARRLVASLHEPVRLRKRAVRLRDARHYRHLRVAARAPSRPGGGAGAVPRRRSDGCARSHGRLLRADRQRRQQLGARAAGGLVCRRPALGPCRRLSRR